MFELMTGFLVTGAALWLIHVAARNHSRKNGASMRSFCVPIDKHLRWNTWKTSRENAAMHEFGDK